MRQLAVNTGLSAFRCILQHCLAIIFRLINDYVTRNKGNQLSVQAFGEFLQQLLLVRCITAVADDTAQRTPPRIAKRLRLGDMLAAYRLISSPVVSVLPTIICAPIQLSARMQQYIVSCITGLLKTRMFSAFMNIFFRLPAAS